MDWISSLKTDIESKKRSLDSISKAATVSTSAPPAKYIKRSDLERQRALAEREVEKLEKEREKTALVEAAAAVAAAATVAAVEDSATSRAADGEPPVPEAVVEKAEAFNVSNEDAVRRLRSKGQPIRLFGETDKERRLRLRALELIEERTEGQQNDLMRALEKTERHIVMSDSLGKPDGANERAVEKNGSDDDAHAAEKKRNPKEENVLVDMSLVKSNPHKIYPQIYHALKKILKEWEQSMDERPESVKRSTQGKIAAATQQTSAEYLKPLFKSLRKRDLAPDVLLAIAEITHNMQIREYLRANDAYLRLSIGNAPWPIGVTMVGIHERSGREKIFSNNVAHVLNDETSRKYIQSLKRLLTFAQTKYPPDDLSQKMG